MGKSPEHHYKSTRTSNDTYTSYPTPFLDFNPHSTVTLVVTLDQGTRGSKYGTCRKAWSDLKQFEGFVLGKTCGFKMP